MAAPFISMPLIGSTFAEFRQYKPGLLPDPVHYEDSVTLKEKLYSIDGQWVFTFRESVLQRIELLNLTQVHTQTVFRSWLHSAKTIIEDMNRNFGSHSSEERGSEQYYDLSPYTDKPAGRRHVYREAIWKFPHWELKIVCEFKSTRANDPLDKEYEDHENDEYWFYEFKLDATVYDRGMPIDKPAIYGRFYIGMPVVEFARFFPALFPHGPAPSKTFRSPDNVQGLKGEWTYYFDAGRLGDFSFKAVYQGSEINEATYNHCKSSTNAILDHLGSRFLGPDVLERSPEGFNAPGRRDHTHLYDIVAKWHNTAGKQVHLEFNRFYGGLNNEVYTVFFKVAGKAHP
jgi:hypothetical protein